MLARLAVRNVRRSVRDYAVYFVTLVFGVAAFYAFNSVQSQSVLFDLEGVASADAFDLTARFLGMFSRPHRVRAGVSRGVCEPLPHPQT